MKEGETVNVGAMLGSISLSKSTNIKDNETEEKKYSPPKSDKIKSTKVINKSKPTSSEKKQLIEPLVLEETTNQKVFDDEPLVLDEEPLVLNNVHEEIENKEKDVIKKDVRVSPAARKIASDKKIDIQSIKGTGKNGLV